MNTYTRFYQENEELAITHSQRENQVIANFCLVNDIDCQFESLGNERWRVYVAKSEKYTPHHLQQCRDAISGILYGLRVKI